jgi:hypothetical protein
MSTKSQGRVLFFAGYAAIWFALLTGIVRIVLLMRSGNYSMDEFTTFIVNYLQVACTEPLPYALVAGIVLALCVRFFPSFDSLALSGLVAGIVVGPLAIWINKNHLPGIREPLSLAVNGAIALGGLSLTILLFRRGFRKFSPLQHIYSAKLMIALFGLLLILNAWYAFQPGYRKIESAPSDVQDFAEYVNAPEAQLLDGHRFDEYFSAKRASFHRRFIERLALHDSVMVVNRATKVIEREFTYLEKTQELPGDIDWRHNPTKDKEWLRALNRQEWLWDLAAAYYLTGEKKFAEEIETMMAGWFQQSEVLRWKDEDDYVWRLIETSVRVTDVWLDAFYVIWPSDDISEEIKCKMLASFHDHGQFLAHFRSPRRNHLLQETFGLLAVAAAFPEFKMAPVWRAIAMKRLEYCIEADVYPDGGYNEGSTYYHRFTIRILQDIIDFGETFGVDFSDKFLSQVEAMYDFLLFTAKPDGVMPAMNDGFHAKNLRILFEKPADIFAREDYRYFATNGTAGREPHDTSKKYPYAGIYVMRSDWSETANYMIIDGGLFGSSHGHEDKLSFELVANGSPFIVESGTYTYVFNRWRRFFRSSQAHNTITIDGRSQIRAPFEDLWVSEPPVKQPNIWFSNQQIDYFEGKYDRHYGNIKEDMVDGFVHTRRILFVKPDYWMIWDVVEGTGSHKVEQLYHFAPWIAVAVVDSLREVIAVDSLDNQVFLKSLSTQTAILEVTEGSEEPIQGWVSSRYGIKEVAPVLTVSVQTELPHSLVTVVIPGNKNDKYKIRLLPPDDGGSEILHLTIESDRLRDNLSISPGKDGIKIFRNQDTSEPAMIEVGKDQLVRDSESVNRKASDADKR